MVQIKPPEVNGDELQQSSVLYRHLDLVPHQIVGGHGNYLVTSDGQEIFDASGGAAVNCIGNGNARVNKAIVDQLDSISYCYSLFFTTSPAEKLAKFLCDSTHGAMSKVFISSSGAEAVEAALKLARQYFTEMSPPQPQRTRFIARKQSYHGNTLGALSVSGHVSRRTPYIPILLPNVSHVSPFYPYRDMAEEETMDDYIARLVQELEDEFQRVGPQSVIAFIAEPVPGGTLGCMPPAPGYFKALKEVCVRHGALFILDEVMAGMGRTGSLHAWEQEDVVPDIQTIGKSLGAGYGAVSATLINKQIVEVLDKGTGAFVHYQTYQGHPVACAAAYEVQCIVKEQNLVENSRVMGDYLGSQLKARLEQHPNVGEIRGRGLFWGIEFVQEKRSKKPFPSSAGVAWAVHNMCLQAPYSISVIPGTGVADGKNGDLIMIAPAFNVTHADVETIVNSIAGAITACFKILG